MVSVCVSACVFLCYLVVCNVSRWVVFNFPSGFCCFSYWKLRLDVGCGSIFLFSDLCCSAQWNVKFYGGGTLIFLPTFVDLPNGM